MYKCILCLLDCLNSDGLIDFNWSHDGSFAYGMKFQQSMSTAEKCADACRDDPTCVGFNYDRTKYCYFYTNKNDLSTRKSYYSATRAYIKCTGIVL